MSSQDLVTGGETDYGEKSNRLGAERYTTPKWAEQNFSTTSVDSLLRHEPAATHRMEILQERDGIPGPSRMTEGRQVDIWNVWTALMTGLLIGASIGMLLTALLTISSRDENSL